MESITYFVFDYRQKSQEEIEKKLTDQMNEKFHTAQMQLREELTKKVT